MAALVHIGFRRLSGTRSPTSPRHHFSTTTDDGVRLYVDGRLVIDQWHDQSTTTYDYGTDLAVGNHTITMEYYENAFAAIAKLTWTTG